MDIITSPQNSISAYLYNAINIEIFEEYESYKYEGKKEPLDFFNLLFSEFTFSNENIENYLTIKSHFKNYDSNPDYNKLKDDKEFANNTLDLYQALTKLIDNKYPINLRSGVTIKSCDYIESILNQLKKIIINYTGIIDDVLSEIKDLNYTEKIARLIEIKYLTLKNEKLFNDEKGMTVAAQCDLEIERLEKLQELELDRNSKTDKTVPEPEPLDLSNTSAVEKIIYLNELGIIDFLRSKPEFKSSTNLIATFLSAITDEEPTTLQTSINRLINNDTDDKNHPYKTKGTVNKIRQTFIDKNIKPKTS